MPRTHETLQPSPVCRADSRGSSTHITPEIYGGARKAPNPLKRLTQYIRGPPLWQSAVPGIFVEGQGVMTAAGPAGPSSAKDLAPSLLVARENGCAAASLEMAGITQSIGINADLARLRQAEGAAGRCSA
jgi:hypothetical protein